MVHSIDILLIIIQLQKHLGMAQKEQKERKTMSRFINLLGKNKMDSSFINLVASSLEKKKALIERKNKKINKSSSKESRNSSNWLGKRKLSLSVHERQDNMTIDRIKYDKNDAQKNKNITVNNFKLTGGALGNSIRLFQPRSLAKSGSERQTQTKVFQKTNSILKKSKIRLTITNRDRLYTKSHLVHTKQNYIQQFLRKREDLIKNNHMDTILTTLTGNPHISKLRIYKDRMKKFYNSRYVRQKITNFFEYEYIQDVSTQMNYLESLLSLSLQEIYFLCFITLDINSDGLICNNDLFTMATILPQNNLLNSDIYRIFGYVHTHYNPINNFLVVDSVSDDDPAKDSHISLHKYRFIMLKQERDQRNKAQSQENSKSSIRKEYVKTIDRVKSVVKTHKPIIMTRKLSRHLFSLCKEEEQGKVAIKQLRKKMASSTTEIATNNQYKFKINFQRYLAIFYGIIPQTYFDILYLQGGIEIQGKKYCPHNYDIDQVQKKVETKIQIPKLFKFREQLNIMRQTLRQNKIQSLKSRYSLYQSCQDENLRIK